MLDSYLTPAGTHNSVLEIKRSKFITSIGLVEDRIAARQFISLCRTEHPDANHHCWAMIAGHPEDIYQQDQSDDGEPRGTAGKPMLNVLQHSSLGNVVVVVTRYFGGTKLGAGGLVRAYTQSVSAALKTLATQTRYLRQQVKVIVPYALLDSLEHWWQGREIVVADRNFTDKIELTLLVPGPELEPLKKRLDELGGGTISYSFIQS